MRERLIKDQTAEPTISAPVRVSGKGETQEVEKNSGSEKMLEQGRSELVDKTDSDGDDEYVVVTDDIQENWVSVTIHTSKFG